MVKDSGRNLKKVKVIMAVVSVTAFLVFAGILYINDYYRATETAKKAMLGNDSVTVTQEEDYYVFSPNREATEKGIIFYPGGKVDETAYAPLLLAFAENGYEVYLIKMPAKLAVFGMDRAEEIIQNVSDISEWTMMGHSLGGAMAASFAAAHDTQVDELVLLAAYSTKDLTDKDIRVYSFYGSEDQVLNMEKYERYHANLPDDTIEAVIDGGNHADYAHYGDQVGDGKATITREEQQECVLDFVLNGEK